MDKKELIRKYNEGYAKGSFFEKNVAYAFSKPQLQEAMQKLGADNESELTSIFGVGDVCLQSKVVEIIDWIHKQHQKRVKWLQSLSDEDKESIIKYELYNHECSYTWDIEPVVDLLQNIFSYDQIAKAWEKVKHESSSE